MTATLASEILIKVLAVGYLIFLLFTLYKVVCRLNFQWLPSLLVTMSLLPWWLLCGMPGARAMEGILFLAMFYAVLLSLVAMPVFVVIHFAIWFPKRKSSLRGVFNVAALGFSLITIGACLAFHFYDRL